MTPDLLARLVQLTPGRLSQIVLSLHENLLAQQITCRSRPGLLLWAQTYLPGHFKHAPSEMHRWLAMRLDNAHRDRPHKINLIGPRGGAKSTIGTLAYVLRVAVEATEPYIWIVSDTKHQAHNHLENIHAELQDNRLLSTRYPHSTGKLSIARANRITLQNAVTIEAFGTGQRIRGRRQGANRPTLIICDDLQNDGHIQSKLQRQKSHDWFHGTLLKAGTPNTNIVNLATALHREALALTLDRTPGWTSRIFPAVGKWPANNSLWQHWQQIYTDFDSENRQQQALCFYRENKSEMDAGAVVLWPEQESLYRLMCMQLESGNTAFQREKQGCPVNPELCEWPESYFDGDIYFDDWPQNIQLKTMALDPSKGNDAGRGDYSAFVMLALDPRGLLYLQADMARRPTPQIVIDGVRLYRRFGPHAFGIESNQFQHLLAPDFEAEFRRQGVADVAPWTLDNHVNKQVRIRRLGPYLSANRIRFKSDCPSTSLLIDQLRDFPIGDHDDGPDAAEMALRLADTLLENNKPHDSLGDRLSIDVD